MPKKHNKSLYAKPSSSPHSSLKQSLTSTGQDGHASSSTKPTSTSQSSVNDLITHLRQTQLPSQQDHGQIATSAQTPRPQRTVHPSLRNLLDIPDTPHPRPKPGQRPRTRRIPGPPPPESWLDSSRHAPRKVQERAIINAIGNAVQRSWSSDGDLILPGCRLPEAGTLTDTVCKSMAQNWLWHSGYDGIWLASLPVRLKEMLLSYIAMVAMEDGSSWSGKANALNLLWPRDHEPESLTLGMGFDALDDSSEVKRLDLGGALGKWTTMKRLRKDLLSKKPSRTGVNDFGLTTSTNVPFVSTTSSVPDNWEDLDEEAEKLSQLPRQPVDAPSTPRFSNLVHLSLALSPLTESPTSTGSWSELLDLSTHLSTLKSLSLANWPLPTLTPDARASNAYMRNPVSLSLPKVRYGGSDMYTELDNGWEEASNILRRLSRNLYCLQWLDLRGCSSWWGALTWSEILEDESNLEFPLDEKQRSRQSDTGPEWNGAWRGITYLGLEVGWTPQTFEERRDRRDQERDTDQGHLRVSDRSSVGLGWNPSIEREKYYQRLEEQRYMELVQRAETTAREIQAIRRRNGGQWVDIQVYSRQSAVSQDLH